MLNVHLSDEQIQELALGNATLAHDVVQHAENCTACKAKVQNYWLLINSIEKQSSPAFDFDLAAAVVAQIEIPPPKSITKGLWWLFAIAMLAILTGAAIYFGQYLTSIVEGLKSLAIYFIAVSGLVLIIMLVIDQYKTYNRKMKLLDMP
jgi:hypothetical protein